jgi:hypothetical protein
MNELFDSYGNLMVDCHEEPVFISVKDEPWTYVVFYQNLFFIFYTNNDTDENVVQIYVKCPDDPWKVPAMANGAFDLLISSNVKIDVYAKYDVIVRKLHKILRRCGGENYIHGVWDKTVCKSLSSFLRTIEDYTEINQIKHAYNK